MEQVLTGLLGIYLEHDYKWGWRESVILHRMEVEVRC